MKRGKKIILIANCLLNVNSKVEGLAEEEGVARIVQEIFSQGYGLIQLPCIEMATFGVKRWGVVKEQCDFPGYRENCLKLLSPVINQIKDFLDHGYEITGVIGLDGSPSCGVNCTVRGNWGGEFIAESNYQDRISSATLAPGMGMMMEILQELLLENDINIPFHGINESDVSSAESADIFDVK